MLKTTKFFSPDDGGSPGAAPADAAPAPAPAPDQTPAQATEQVPDQAPAPTPAPAPAEPQPKPWYLGRIDDLTGQKHRLEAELTELRAKLSGTAPPAAPQPAPAGAPNVDAIRTEAARIAAAERFNSECNKVAEQGRAAFKDFDAVLANWVTLGGLPATLVEAALETGKAHEVIYELGRNMDKALQLVRLPPVRQAAQVAAFASSLRGQAVSQAPAPLPTSVGAGAQRDRTVYDDDLSTEDWIRLRNAQVAGQR